MSERLRPINDDDMLVIDTTNGDILGIQPRHKPDDRASFGGGIGGGTVQDGLYVVEIGGQTFALVPVVGGAVEANIVPRTGNRATLETLAGEAGEIASIDDERGIMLFTGIAGQARGVYSTNAGRTVVVSLPPVPYTGPVIELGPDVLEVHFRYSSPPTDVRDPDQIPSPQVRFTGARTTAQRVRVFQEYPVIFLEGINGGPNCSLLRVEGGRSWSELLLDTTTTPPTYRAFSSAYAESSESPEVFAPGSVRLGSEAYAFGRQAVALGNGAIANMASEIAFGSPAYSALRGNRIIRVGAQTTGVNGTAVLTTDGAAVSEANMFGFDLSFGASAFGMRLDIMGKRSNSTECVRFVREVVVQRASTGALTLITPATPNNPSDILTAQMTGADVALSIASVGAGTNNALQIQVTGPNTSMTTRWSCIAYVHAMGNG